MRGVYVLPQVHGVLQAALGADGVALRELDSAAGVRSARSQPRCPERVGDVLQFLCGGVRLILLACRQRNLYLCRQ